MRVEELLNEIEALSAPERAELVTRLREHPEFGPLVQAPKASLRKATTPAPSSSESPDDAHYLIIFDGGSKGNPGEGYGSFALVRCDTGEQRVVRLDFPGLVTNNEAEYMTLIEALRTLVEKITEHDKSPARLSAYRIEVRGDSQLVVRQVNREWKARDERMRALRDEALEYLEQFGAWRLLHHDREQSVEVLGH